MGDVHVAAEKVPYGEPEHLRMYADRILRQLSDKKLPGLALVASESTGRVVVSSNSAIDAGKFVHALAEEFGGAGGGRPHLGQGGLKDVSRVGDLVEKVMDPSFFDRLRRKIVTPP